MTDPLYELLPADFRPLTTEYPAADTLKALEAANQAALERNRPGYLTPMGLVIIPAAFDRGAHSGIREAELPALVSKLRALEGLSIRGCVVRPALPGADGKTVAAAFHEVYQTAKRMSALLPCAMPFLGFGGMLGPIAACLREDPAAREEIQTAAEIVAMQNRTAFYAKLLID